MDYNVTHFVYKTTNLLDGKFYIGVHVKNPVCKRKSPYLGTGKHIKRAIKKYGEENFLREVLMEFDNEEDAYKYEKDIVTESLIRDKNCYNIELGGNKPPSHKGIKKSDEWKEKVRNTKLGNSTNSKRWYIKGKIFESSREAAKYFNVHMASILNWCKRDDMPDCYNEQKDRVYVETKKKERKRETRWIVKGIPFHAISDAGKHFGVNGVTCFNWVKNNKPDCYKIQPSI